MALTEGLMALMAANDQQPMAGCIHPIPDPSPIEGEGRHPKYTTRIPFRRA